MSDQTVAATPATPDATTKKRRFSSRAPQRPAPAVVAVATTGSVLALLALVGLGALLDQVWLIPPLAASAALVFGAPALPLAQPRSVIGGQLLSALTGFAVLAAAGDSAWAAALAGGLALGVMALGRTPHSPAAATAVIVVAQQPSAMPFLPVLAGATVVLVAVGVLAGRTGVTPRYPTYWW